MNLNWSNALSTAGGGAAAVGLEGVRATLDQQKIQLASDLAEKRQVGAEQRAPALAAATAGAVGDANAASAVRNAPGLLGVDVARQKALNEENTRAELERFKALAPAKRAEEIGTAVEKLKALATPEMLANERAIAQAKHIVDPSFSLIPNPDGTVTTFDNRSGKTGGVLKDADGKPIERRDPEEMRAAVAVINLANTNLRIAEAAYKADATSLEPGVKEKATVAWTEAQREAKQISAPAYAVLYAKAKIPGVDDKEPAAPAGKTGWDSATGEVWKDGEKIGTARSAAEARSVIQKPAATAKPAAPLLSAASTVDGRIDPSLEDSPERARQQAELEEARKRRLASVATNQTTVGLMNSLAR